MSRTADFRAILAALSAEARLSAPEAIVAEGDSLDLLAKIPDGTISLILTDPPYHSTKKENIYGDTHFKEDSAYIEWMGKFIAEWKRILRPNGTIFCFCATEMSARLEIAFSKDFNILSHVVWTKPNEPGFDGWKGKMKKEALRQWYPHSERIIFAEPASQGNLHRSPFGLFLRQMRQQAGLSGHELTEQTGAYGKVNHGGAVSNWETGRNIPSRDQYDKIVSAFLQTGRVESMPAYEDVIRPFIIDKTREFTDVWNFPSVRPYKGKHPAEKPASMLEHAIESTTFKGDIVLDCFAGSGSTALAALSLGRLSVSMEIETVWADRIAERVALGLGSNLERQKSTQQKETQEPDAPLFSFNK
ncbi:MAG: site-specific DNA-methyltransferase [Alphaproteobacteria bacterium]|nr:MAG: site-specific DNA-methyltransferase [Alphaproteobacteria bacterium]